MSSLRFGMGSQKKWGTKLELHWTGASNPNSGAWIGVRREQDNVVSDLFSPSPDLAAFEREVDAIKARLDELLDEARKASRWQR